MLNLKINPGKAAVTIPAEPPTYTVTISFRTSRLFAMLYGMQGRIEFPAETPALQSGAGTECARLEAEVRTTLSK